MKPILFNTEMVRAILDGRKTVTRRIIKPQPKSEVVFHLGQWQETQMCANGLRVLTPPFKVGDVLYVRETWGKTADLPGISEEETVYAADFSDKELAHLKDRHFRWRPSIHMPKELARLYLRVTEVRAERLQNMRLADVLAEGITKEVGATWEKWCNLWDSTIPKEELATCGWKANPWVWVIQFEVREKPGDQ
jgi:hypothetical protein